MGIDKYGETRSISELSTDTTRRGGLRLEMAFVESPQDFMKDFRVVFDLSVIREVTLGRSPDNIVVIPDPTVSRKHAVISTVGEGEVIIRDLGSTNGTYILEEGGFRRISEYRLPRDSLLRLGYYTVMRLILYPQ
jgi:hypothetical protein